jgi:hypothetical protein
VALVASLAFAALASSSASAISVSPGGNSTIASTSAVSWKNEAGSSFSCGSISGNGQLSGAAGTYSLSFKDCKGALGGGCTTAGQPTGVIKTKPLTVNLEYIDAAKTKYGLGFKPTSGTTFAEFNCGYAVSWLGGVIGQITKPALNTPASTWTVEFAAKASGYQPLYNFLLPTQEWLASGGKTGWYYDYTLQEKTAAATRPMAITAVNNMSWGGVPNTIAP